MSLPPPAPVAPDSYDAFYQRLNSSARTSVDRHLAACESDPTSDHLRLWKRLAGFLAGLTPHSIRTTGQRAVQFFAADGAYRRQLFALEDLRDGKLSVYLADVLGAGAKAGILRVEPGEHPGNFSPCEAPDESIAFETLSAAATTSAPEYYRHLLGWNRRAVRIMIPPSASAAQIRAVERLCTLAAGEALAQLRADEAKGAKAAGERATQRTG
jgi:hypothetical protein